MNVNLKNNTIITICYTFILILVIINSQNAFFWDTVQLGSLHANYYFSTNYSSLLLPDNIDSGHIPAFGIYISFIWDIFGRSLLTSHLAMLPFALGIVFQLYKLIKKITLEQYWGFAIILVLIDPSLMSQLTLISPDIPLVFFFLFAINSVLDKKRRMILFSIILLFLISMRGMMVALSILFLDMYYNILFTKNIKQLSIDLSKRSLIYLPALIIFILFNGLHYLEKGWIGFHTDSPWAPSFEAVDLKGFIFNIGILGWRIIDFGRIGIWIVFIILIIKYWKEVLNSKKTRLLLFFFITTLILLSANMLWAKNLIGHRYLIPVYISFSLLCINILFSNYVTKKVRFILSTLWIIIVITGNLWIYPPKIAQGWDSTLAHLPYYNLRKEAILYIDNENIDIAEVASFFPNKSPFDAIDLNGSQKHFSEYTGNNEYIFYSNIYNVSDIEFEQIINKYIIIKSFKKNGIYIWICKKNTNNR